MLFGPVTGHINNLFNRVIHRLVDDPAGSAAGFFADSGEEPGILEIVSAVIVNNGKSETGRQEPPEGRGRSVEEKVAGFLGNGG